MVTTSITAEGKHTISLRPELCTVSISVKHEAGCKQEAIEPVVAASGQVADILQSLAPPSLATVENPLDGTSIPEIRDASKSCSKWTMSRVSNYDWKPWWDKKKDIEPARVYSSTSSFSATFHDFRVMEEVVQKLNAMKHVNIGHISWHLLKATHKALEKAVRQGAMRDALEKVEHYTSVFTENKAKPVNISDGATSLVHTRRVVNEKGLSRSSDRSMAFSARRAESGDSDDNNDNEDRLSFEPDEVTITSRVEVAFEVEA